MRHFKNFATLGFLLLVDVCPAPVKGQVLSLNKLIPPIGDVAKLTGDGIYTVSSNTFLRKYDHAGTLLWSREFAKDASAIRNDLAGIRLALNNAGIFASGSSDTIISTSSGRVIVTDSFVNFYDTQGNEKWTKKLKLGSGATRISAQATDDDGIFVFVTYFEFGRTQWGLRKYSNQGLELWTKTGDIAPQHAIADASGLYTSLISYDLGYAFDSWDLRKYDSTGAEVWKTPFEEGISAGIAVNDTGVWVAGYGPEGVFLRRYDIYGNVAWTRSGLGGSSVMLQADAEGVYMAGSTNRALPGQCALGSYDAFVRRFDNHGNLLWTRQFGSLASEILAGIAADTGGVFVAGPRTVAGLSNVLLARLEKAAVAVSPSLTRIHNECVVNAASYVGGGVSVGEIVTIFGTALGPAEPVSASITADRPAETTLAGTRVHFSGIPAPLIYTSSEQVTAIVPSAAADKRPVEIQVEYRGARSQTIRLPVLPAHPGIFSMNASGEGQAAVVNEDGTLNSTANPAPRGSIIAIYATGGGETSPATAGGAAAGNPQPILIAPVRATFTDGDYRAFSDALYAGAVSGFVAGLLQVNVRVPDSLSPGRWTLALEVGNGEIPSPESVQVSVR